MNPVTMLKDRYHIIIADHHPLIREGVKMILTDNDALKVVGEAVDGFGLLHLLRNMSPDMVILEISKELGGTKAISEIKTLSPQMKVLVLTAHKAKRIIHDAFRAGADGYVLKEDRVEVLLSAIESLRMDRTFMSAVLLEGSTEDWVQIIRGDKRGPFAEPLTQRQSQILALVAEGRSSKDIASLLSISVHTVARHRASIRERLRIVGTGDLVRFAALRDAV